MTSGRCVHMLHKLATLPISAGVCGVDWCCVVVEGTRMRHMEEPALGRERTGKEDTFAETITNCLLYLMRFEDKIKPKA